MPILHQYVDTPDYYIRGNIGGNYITYQVSPVAAKSLQSTGFDRGSTISWTLCRELVEEGLLYTYRSGIDTTEGVSDGDLSDQEKKVLRGLKGERKEIEVPENVVSYLTTWSNKSLSESDIQDIVHEIRDPNWLFSSVRSFAVVTAPDSFSIEKGSPAYSYTKPTTCVVRDDRYGQSERDFLFRLIGVEGIEIELVVSDGGLDTWGIEAEEVTDNHISLFLDTLPWIFDILDRLPGTQLDVGNWHFLDGRRVKLSKSQTQKIGHSFQELAYSYGLDEGPATGYVLSKGYAGHGRISIDEVDASIPFHSRNCTKPGIRTGDEVRFDVELIGHTFHAKNIERLRGTDE